MFRCRDLLALPNMSRAKLIAGEGGLDNGIRWAYKAENMNFAVWVHGQELLIVSTPVISSVDFNLYKVIEEAIRMKLSGVLLLVGEEYISSIDAKAMALADRKALPVISIPGEIPLVDILEELGHAIAFQDKKISVHEDFLAEIVFGNKIESKMISRWAELIDYELKDIQRVFMIHFDFGDESKAHGLMTIFSEKLESLFSEKECGVVVSKFHCNLIGITGEDNEATLNSVFEAFCKWVCNKEPQVTCKVGVGGAYSELTLLNKSFSEASAVLKLAKPIQWYEKLGFIKLLIDVDDQKKLYEYMKQVLGGIIAHDENTKSDLIKTLAAYFECDENMKAVGSKIYIHPNTVKYRLSQIQEISGLNLSITDQKMELYNALLIWRILGSE